MASQNSENTSNAFQKTAVCVSLSVFYIAMLAWPFGLTETGYMASRALMAGAAMFALSIPAWVVNIKREFFSGEAEVAETAAATEQVSSSIDQLALNNK